MSEFPRQPADRTGRLAGKVAIVVGGGASGPPLPTETVPIGNGRATSIQCAREGAIVLVGDIRQELAQETVDLIRKEGGLAEPFGFDASMADECRVAVEAAVSHFGRVDLLVNVIGIGDGKSLNDVDLGMFDRCFEVNVRSNLLMMKYASEEMRKVGGGAIVNVSSIAALRSGVGVAYETTKAAQVALSRAAAVTLAKHNIRVNTVVLGTIDTPMLRRSLNEDAIDRLASRIPLGRPGSPWAVASAIVFLLSDDAAFVTGTELLIDGGDRATP